MNKSNIRKFQDLYGEFADGVFRYCFYKTSDRDIATDITQEVFIKIWEFLNKGGEFQNTKAFVYTTASRKIIDWYRSKKVSVSLDLLKDDYGFDIEYEQRENGVMLDGKLALDKIKELSPDYREVLLLRYVEDFGVSEIATILGEKENAISVRLHRALEKLKKIYK